MNDTYAMMDELHIIVERIQARRAAELAAFFNASPEGMAIREAAAAFQELTMERFYENTRLLFEAMPKMSDFLTDTESQASHTRQSLT